MLNGCTHVAMWTPDFTDTFVVNIMLAMSNNAAAEFAEKVLVIIGKNLSWLAAVHLSIEP